MAAEEAKGMVDRVTAELRAVCNRVVVSGGGVASSFLRVKYFAYSQQRCVCMEVEV